MFFSREILVALVVGVILVTGSFYVGASDETVPGDITVIDKAPERTYIEVPDRDGDGVSDWAEELLNDREAITAAADPIAAYVPPETLTGRFGIKFFHDYLVQKGIRPDDTESKEALAAQAVEVLQREGVDSIITIDDISISPDDSIEAQRAYGNAIAEIVSRHSRPSEYGEIEILNQALTAENPERLTKLDPIIDAYADYLTYTMAVPVPPSLVQQHLDLLNVYQAVHNDIVAMRNTFEDPLLSMVRFKRYQEDISGMIFSYYSIDLALRRSGITYQEDEPGAIFSLLTELRQMVQ